MPLILLLALVLLALPLSLLAEQMVIRTAQEEISGDASSQTAVRAVGLSY